MIIPIHQIADLRNVKDKEILLTNASGGYLSTSAVLLNRRKYHSLMVCNLENENSDNISLLSSLDETLITQSGNYELSTHIYPNTVYPEGYRYINQINPNKPYIIYMVGDIKIKKEFVFVNDSNRLLVKYSVLDCKKDFILKLVPLFAYRSIHTITRANENANKEAVIKENSVIVQLYDKFPCLHIQSDRRLNFYPKSEWFYNIEYDIEKTRGYEYTEDLLSVGSFEINLKNTDEIIVSFSTKEENLLDIEKVYTDNLKKQEIKSNGTLTEMLERAAKQFIVKQAKETKIVAGYPWFGSWGRDAFISLEGLTIDDKNAQTAIAIVDSMIKSIKDGLFINMGQAYNSVDAPLWFFHSMQWIAKTKGNEFIYKKYYNIMKDIIDAYRYGKNEGIAMEQNALIYADIPGKALTWMDAIVSSGAVTARAGYQVEINALWYNAVCYTLSLAKEFNDTKTIMELETLPKTIKNSFLDIFWSKDNGFLADYSDRNATYFEIRPNQIIATSLEYSMLTNVQKSSIMKIIKKELLTPCGLRTLSRDDYRYCPYCIGVQEKRDKAYHNGTIWVWQLEHYVKCGFDTQGNKFIDEAKKIYNGFEELTQIFGIGSVAEIYDGDAPHSPQGSISQAWSVAALLRINQMIKQFDK